ncbi:recombinase family protein [Rhizobium sp. CF142]|uniref:recombinase family protein n=1 Tax=Rhizobium sp. CF142 TaxID=1144314 RepID=UPI0002D6F710|nr:recombinase family protein [Rhizobium sp. CF142]
MKKIAYLRVSTAEQNPDRQIEGLKHIADELHIETLSAVARHRPVYDRVIGRLRRGDMLVVWALDRAYRSAKDALIELDALRERGVYFQIANLDLDTTTPHGRFIYTIMSGASQYEREMLIERTKEGIAAARAQGKRIGRPPKLTQIQLFDAHHRIVTGQATRVQIAAEYKIAPWSLTRAIKRSVEALPN